MIKNRKFANRLAVLRKRNNETQKQFAENLSVYMLKDEPISPLTISAWENGHKLPSMVTLMYLANYFGVTSDYLLGLSDDMGEKAPVSREDLSAKPDYRISPADLVNYHKKPVYVVFRNMEYRNQWGVLDYERKVVVFFQLTMTLGEMDCDFYAAVPEDEKTVDYSKRKPYSMPQLLESSEVWVNMLSKDDFIKGKYDGWYRHNENHTALINKIGLVLPYEGLNQSYIVYPSEF